jgi:hypothetical protein
VEGSGTNHPTNEGPGAGPDPAPAPTGTSAAGSPVMSAEGRKATLDAALQRTGAEGWRIETRSDFQATIAKGKPLNNKLHVLLTIFTLGVWGIVWASLAISGGIKRRMITIDDYGSVIDSTI